MIPIKSIENTTGVMHLTWIINNICNRACNYCPDSLHNGKNHHYEWHHVEKFITTLQSRHDRIHVTISGGEPTMSPWLIDLIDLLRSKNNTVGITSNGARTLRYYKELAPKLRYICLSYHPEEEDAEFLEKAIECSRYTLTKINFMMPATHWDQCIKMYDRIKQESALTYEPVKITEWHPHPHGLASRNYSPEQLEWFKNNNGKFASIELCKQYDQQINTPTPLLSTINFQTGSERLDPTYLINTNQHHFTGWTCWQGIESLFVQYTGQIGASNCSQNRDLGWIQQLDDIKWIQEPVECKQVDCICSSDIFITKTNPITI